MSFSSLDLATRQSFSGDLGVGLSMDLTNVHFPLQILDSTAPSTQDKVNRTLQNHDFRPSNIMVHDGGEHISMSDLAALTTPIVGNLASKIEEKLQKGEYEGACNMLEMSNMHYGVEEFLVATGQLKRAKEYRRAVYEKVYKISPEFQILPYDKMQFYCDSRIKNIRGLKYEELVTQNINILMGCNPYIQDHTYRNFTGNNLPFVQWVVSRLSSSIELVDKIPALEKNKDFAAAYFAYRCTNQDFKARQYIRSIFRELTGGLNPVAWEKEVFEAWLQENSQNNENNPEMQYFLRQIKALRDSELEARLLSTDDPARELKRLISNLKNSHAGLV